MRAALRSAVRGEKRDSSANQTRSARTGSGTGRSVVLFFAAAEEALGVTDESGGRFSYARSSVRLAAATTDSNAATARDLASGSLNSRAEW